MDHRFNSRTRKPVAVGALVLGGAALAVMGTFGCGESLGAPYMDGNRIAPPSNSGTAYDAEEPPPPPDPEKPESVDVCSADAPRDAQTLYLSADDSNSMASPVIARGLIMTGSVPPPATLRTYEFLNYYNVPYPVPQPEHVNLVPEMREGDEAGEFVLQIGVQAPLAARTPQPRTITLILDRSGSMGGRPIDRARDVVRAIAANLREGDIVSAVTWNTQRDVPLENHRVSGPSDPALLRLADSLEADGGTDLDAGLRYGYEIARRLYDPERLNRVVLVSDGWANAGQTEIGIIDDASEDAERDGIYLVGVGVADGYNDTLMDAVTDAGRGAYVFIDSAAEAQRMFGERWNETMEVGMLDVRVELTLPWYLQVTEFHGEEISTDPERVRPQHLSPGDAMVYHQILSACDGQLDPSDTIGFRVTYVRPNGRVEAEERVERTIGELLASPSPGLARGDIIVEYAEALAETDPAERSARLARTIQLIDALSPEVIDEGIDEIRDLATRARRVGARYGY